MTAQQMKFVKMNGIGNSIIVADARGRADEISIDAAVKLSAPDAVPFDQIMEVRDPSQPGWDNDIRILNSDGSLAQACGNGTRCVVAWLHAQDGQQDFKFKTAGGMLDCHYDGDDAITVDMGSPRFDWQDIPLAEEFYDTTGIELQIGPIDDPILHTPSVVNMGNPHAIFWVDDDPANYDLERFGPLLENHPIFPERANITVAKIHSDNHVQIRVWERGAGITLACGSAACATLVAAARKGLTGRTARISLPGGDLQIVWNDRNRILMTGSAEFEYSGELDPATGAFIRREEMEPS